MSTATATKSLFKNLNIPTEGELTPHQAFWKFVSEEVTGYEWENLEQFLPSIPHRRLHWIANENCGITTMTNEEIEAFAELLKVDAVYLIKTYGCGIDKVTLRNANLLVASRGLMWDVVNHVA